MTGKKLVSQSQVHKVTQVDVKGCVSAVCLVIVMITDTILMQKTMKILWRRALASSSSFPSTWTKAHGRSCAVIEPWRVDSLKLMFCIITLSVNCFSVEEMYCFVIYCMLHKYSCNELCMRWDWTAFCSDEEDATRWSRDDDPLLLNVQQAAELVQWVGLFYHVTVQHCRKWK